MSLVIYSPSGGVTYICNGVDVHGLPIAMYETSGAASIYTVASQGAGSLTIPAGAMTYTRADYHAQCKSDTYYTAQYPPGTPSYQYAEVDAASIPLTCNDLLASGGGPRLMENFGGVYGYYSGFAPVPSQITETVARDGSNAYILGTWNCTINTLGSYAGYDIVVNIYSGPYATKIWLPPQAELGTHVLDITPYVMASVTQVLDSTPFYSGTVTTYSGLNDVKVTIEVIRSGSSYKLLDRAKTSDKVLFSLADDSIFAPYYVLETRDYSRAGNDGVLAQTGVPAANFNQLFMPKFSHPSSVGASGSLSDFTCPTPAQPYDPYFGRDPHAVKDVVALKFMLEFPDGTVWQGDADVSSLFGVVANPNGTLNMPGCSEGDGLVYFPNATQHGVNVSIHYQSNPCYSYPGPDARSFNWIKNQNNYLDPSATQGPYFSTYNFGEYEDDWIYPGNDGTTVYPNTQAYGAGLGETRSSQLYPLPYLQFSFVLDQGFGNTKGPPGSAPLPGSRVLLVPAMDVDTVSGRMYLVIGSCSYEAEYSQSISPQDGSAALQLVRYHKHHSGPIYLSTDQSGNVVCPFTTGNDIGVTTPDVPPGSDGSFVGQVALPDSIVILPQNGEVRVGYRVYDPTSGNAGLLQTPTYRTSRDLGDTWSDGPDLYPSSALISNPAANRAFLSGSRRGRRTLPKPSSAEPSAGSEMTGGSTGWGFTRGRAIAQKRMPIWTKLSGSSGILPEGSQNSGGVSFVAVVTTDDAKTVNPVSNLANVPSVGSTDPDLYTVPGYLYPGEWAGNPNFSQPIFGYPADSAGSSTFSHATAVNMAPVSPLGGLCWARGYSNSARMYLFCPGIMQMPIPRKSYTPSKANDLDEGFYSDTDPAVSGVSGPYFGHKTCITYSVTEDGGMSYGDLKCVKVNGSPVLVHTETVRIAAVCGPGDILYLVVCADGKAVLYHNTDGGFTDFHMIGISWDAGADWSDPTSDDIARGF